ncbi:MAG: glycosyltransferase family 4 protein [Verrucomicrobiota bacterium]
MGKNLGFVSTRFAGTDGVSLESAKWGEVLEECGHSCFWYSGRNDRDPSISVCIPEAYFGDPENCWINERIWNTTRRDRIVTDRIREMADYLKSTLDRFVQRFEIDILIPENALTIPMHLPLGVAITEYLNESQIPAIAHHHDFFWERTRFSVGAVNDILDMAFPPTSPNLHHTVINQEAQQSLSFRKGVGAALIPNVFEFEKEPPAIDDYSRDIREEIGLKEDDIFVLQPTRIVPRKGIEHAIKLIGMLNDPRYKLVISHDAGDEGFEYKHMLVELAREEKVDVRFISDRVGEVRQLDARGRKIYTLWDLYPHADLVTYPSTYEGFGNALLEALYFRKPVVINRYSIFVRDIEPKGFRLVVMDGFVTQANVRYVRMLMENEAFRQSMVDHNYTVARRYYGYNMLRNQLGAVMRNITGHESTAKNGTPSFTS